MQMGLEETWLPQVSLAAEDTEPSPITPILRVPRFGSGVSSLLAVQGQRAVSGVWDVEPRARILVLRVAAAFKSQSRAPGLLGAAPPPPCHLPAPALGTSARKGVRLSLQAPRD